MRSCQTRAPSVLLLSTLHHRTRLPSVAPAAFWGLLFLNSFLAYFVNLTNFLVTKHTSALTLQV